MLTPEVIEWVMERTGKGKETVDKPRMKSLMAFRFHSWEVVNGLSFFLSFFLSYLWILNSNSLIAPIKKRRRYG